MGKHALNFDRDTVERVLVSADEKSVKNLEARGPGVRGMGGKGGGDGEGSRAEAGIFLGVLWGGLFFGKTTPEGGELTGDGKRSARVGFLRERPVWRFFLV